jgi:hypothetical protein
MPGTPAGPQNWGGVGQQAARLCLFFFFFFFAICTLKRLFEVLHHPLTARRSPWRVLRGPVEDLQGSPSVSLSMCMGGVCLKGLSNQKAAGFVRKKINFAKSYFTFSYLVTEGSKWDSLGIGRCPPEICHPSLSI